MGNCTSEVSQTAKVCTDVQKLYMRHVKEDECAHQHEVPNVKSDTCRYSSDKPKVIYLTGGDPTCCKTRGSQPRS